MATVKTYIIQLHNQYDWNDNYTMKDIKEAIEGYNCSPECETISLKVDYIKEFSGE